jgi:uncharacterized membrane protein required for colicin V production
LSINVFDVLFVAVPLVFFVLGFVRGPGRELFSLLGVAAGAVLAGHYHRPVADRLAGFLPDRDFAALAVFLLILLLGYLVGAFAGGFMDQRHQQGAPTTGGRLLAGLFAGAKGIVLCWAVLWLVQAYVPPFRHELSQSRVAPTLEAGLAILTRYNPW